MPGHEIDLLTIVRGLITAPAGCGKTHLIGSALKRHENGKPVLVLTHTNSGVAALRGRLDRAGVSTKAYRLQTIDGWAMRLARTFPLRAALPAGIIDLHNPGKDYPAIRHCAANLLRRESLDDVLAANFSRVFVDEYQDCGVRQHAMVQELARILPTIALGDPMQAIFNFGADPIMTWAEIQKAFPLVGELRTPWRWKNANAEKLGEWLLDVRSRLLNGDAIDIRSAPQGVRWVHLDGTNDHAGQLAAAKADTPTENGRTLIIGDSRSPESQRRFASRLPGAVTVEAVDLKDLVAFAKSYDVKAQSALPKLLEFAHTVMTNVGVRELLDRVRALIKGSARNGPSDMEGAALAFLRDQSFSSAVDLLIAISAEAAVRVHRPAVLRACVRAMQLCGSGTKLTFREAAVMVREENRLIGRPLAQRNVGSTLLLKGLEAEGAVILNADDLDARNLYVAMTRGSMALTICSSHPILRRAKPT